MSDSWVFVITENQKPLLFENQSKNLSNLRTICRTQTMFSFINCRHQFRFRASFWNPNCKPYLQSRWLYSTWLGSSGNSSRPVPQFRLNQKRTVVKAMNWDPKKNPIWNSLEKLGKINLTTKNWAK